MKKLFAVVSVIALVLCAGSAELRAAEQKYPTKTVEIIVPTSAGGNLDLVARSLAPSLTKALGRTVHREQSSRREQPGRHPACAKGCARRSHAAFYGKHLRPCTLRHAECRV